MSVTYPQNPQPLLRAYQGTDLKNNIIILITEGAVVAAVQAVGNRPSDTTVVGLWVKHVGSNTSSCCPCVLSMALRRLSITAWLIIHPLRPSYVWTDYVTYFIKTRIHIRDEYE